MIIHEEYEDLDLKHPVVTMGVFDGVHSGHRALIDYLVSRARKVGGEAVVVTFNPHPRLVLPGNKEGLSFLSTLDEKKRLLNEALIDHLIIIRFDKDLSNLKARDFIKQILVDKIGVKYFIIGYDHHFGKSRKGDLNIIRKCGEAYDFIVEQVSEVSAPGGIISSTSIREALLSGHLEEANRWLGYNYSLSGTVVEGRKLGRLLGFPTANIKPDDDFKLVPANGVYAVEVQFEDKKLPGMLSIGFNPTVNKNPDKRFIEVNIFNFDKKLYNNEIRVIFRFRMRDEVKFDNMDQLSEQMRLDKQQALSLLE
jgi:riboflavin kinase / FMN adenylyltransferase